MVLIRTRHYVSVAVVVLAVLSACGGGSGGTGGGSGAAKQPGSQAKKGPRPDPVQLTVDPCTLVTRAEAEKAMGASLKVGGGTGAKLCTYEEPGGVFSVQLLEPLFCKMLISELDNPGVLAGDQIGVADVADGGVQTKGGGSVQFLSHGGCVELNGKTPQRTSATTPCSGWQGRRRSV